LFLLNINFAQRKSLLRSSVSMTKVYSISHGKGLKKGCWIVQKKEGIYNPGLLQKALEILPF
jgi:hypothetical protein